jgi:hypothetical protein
MAKKVFISSVMRDFQVERQAAKQAVEALDLRPVMAEDFGSKPHSPKTACLEGVRASDIYIGIVGPRYGYVTPKGASVTEEEFEEARKRGVPILWFVKKGDMEAKQRDFVEQIGNYEEGYFLSHFATSSELVLAVTKALNSIVAQPGIELLSSKAAGSLLQGYFESLGIGQTSDPVVAAVILPERQGIDYLSVLDLGIRKFKDNLLQPALFGTGAVFDRTLGTRDQEGREHLEFEQEDQRGSAIARLRFHTDGALAWHRKIVEPRNSGTSLLRMHVLDQDEVQRQLTAFLHYAKWFVGQLADASLISSLYLWISILGASQRKLGHIPPQDIHSISIGMNTVEDPLVIPQKPMKVPRTELNAPDDLAVKLMTLLERAFKAARAYYEPGS